MKKLHTTIMSAALAVATLGSASAAPTIGSGAGYYGGAEFVGPSGMVVGPYPTYAQCDAALQAGLYNQINNHGHQLESIIPCRYRPPYTVAHEHYELMVVAGSPGESGDVAVGLLHEATKLREAFRIDEYDRAVLRLIEITDPELDGVASYPSSR